MTCGDAGDLSLVTSHFITTFVIPAGGCVWGPGTWQNAPVRIDAENSRLEISVADLLEAGARGSLNIGQRGGYERMWIGQAIHTRYQDEQRQLDPTYQSEVPVRAVVTVRGWEVVVRGRIDGLRRDGDLQRVQEIKSVRRDRPPSVATMEMYRQQAAAYAWMLAQEDDSGTVDAELVLVDTSGYGEEVEDLELDLVAVDRWIRKRLQRLVGDAQRQAQRSRERAEAGARLSFPHTELRPGQESIIEATSRAIEHGEHLLIEAPTGLGKTAATIYPTLKAALEQDLRVYVLTAKNLQQEMALKVLAVLNSESAFSSLQLRAKARMCANDEVVCHEDYCRFARDYFTKLHASGVVDQLEGAGDVRPDEIFNLAGQWEVCPFEVSLELSRRCQTIVGDYNYAFDPYISLRDFGPEGNLEDSILIIDEVHNLVERARGYWSPELSASKLREAADFAAGNGPSGPAVAHLVRRIADAVDESVNAAFADQVPSIEEVEGEIPEDALTRLRPDFDDAFLDHLEALRASKALTADDPLREQYYAFQRFMDTLSESSGESGFSRVLRRRGSERSLQILCLDPSAFLRRVLERARAVIGLSATLSPPEFYRDMLGLEPHRFAFERIPSTFPPENRALVVDDGVSTLWRDRPDNYGLIAERLSAFAEQIPGNALALFPSYQFLAEIASRVQVRGKRIAVQEQANSATDRETLLANLSDGTGDVLLLAVAGGVFAEGVDYPGDMLKAVAVVGPALPPVNLERELLKQHFEEKFERGFEYAFVLPGMTRVVQAAGRLIRSDTDTGVIALLGHRFKRAPYANYLPDEWVPDEGPHALTGVPEQAAKAFFARDLDHVPS